MTTWFPTRTEQALTRCKWYEDLPHIEALTDRAEQGIPLFELHGPGVTPQCGTAACDRCRRLEGVLICFAARQYKRSPDLTFFELLKTPMYKSAIKTVLDKVGANSDGWTGVSELAEMAAVGAHLAFGLRTYEVSKGLIERLKLTGLSGIPDEEVRLPYGSTWYQFPRGSIRTRTIDAQKKVIDVTGALLREFTREYSGMKGKTNRYVDLSLFACDASKPDSAEYLLFSIELPLNIGWEDRLSSIVKLDAQGSTKGDFSVFEQFMPVFWDLLVNTILYSTWPETGQREEVVRNTKAVQLLDQVKRHPKGTHKHDRAKDALKRIPHYRRTVLGGTVQALPSGMKNGNPLTVGSLVQGHWQRFAVGPGRLKREWRYREPFWRGPTDTPEVKTRHVLL